MTDSTNQQQQESQPAIVDESTTTNESSPQAPTSPQSTPEGTKRTASEDLDSSKTKSRKTDETVKDEQDVNTQKHADDHNHATAIPLLTEQQHQQLLQSYAQATGQDLANLTASSLAQAMVSPMAVPGLTSNLLQQLQGNVITALPGPPPTQPTQESVDDNKRTNVRNMTNDERRQRRLLRNRVAAKECRKKKKQYIQEMEEKISRLEEENARLHKQIEDLNTKLAMGTLHQGSESYRLMKEVEELNAKLGMHMPPGGLTAAAVMAAASQTSSHPHPAPHPSSCLDKPNGDRKSADNGVAKEQENGSQV
ncbi:hypothetical protein EC973_003494 [Apophysomyces ossiformis]|uniref:BZIP domain-containing protein n=1 Tax=Apophysomyces ossiformis TaxID=679940 RepID=A0A8H7EMC3_9FUNG|nr:hypothetical protein EC973_003494 [Apophysomyces ossiformis]